MLPNEHSGFRVPVDCLTASVGTRSRPCKGLVCITAALLTTLSLFAPFALAAPIPELEWSRCASLQNDRERLDCFDVLTSKSRSARSQQGQKSPDVLNDVIRRCRSQMGSYGSSMVKACVDQDMDAHRALRRYPAEHTTLVERCERQMGNYGWSMVKACADQDIEAERALRRMNK